MGGLQPVSEAGDRADHLALRDGGNDPQRPALTIFGRIAILPAPERLQRLDYRPYGRFIIREQVRYVFVRTSAPVRPHSAGFERTYLDAKRGHFLGQGLSESANSPLSGVVRRAAGKSQATAH